MKAATIRPSDFASIKLTVDIETQFELDTLRRALQFLPVERPALMGEKEALKPILNILAGY